MHKISIVVVTYNRWIELERCIQSILSQTYKSIEIIIIDNNSQLKITPSVRELLKNNSIIFKKMKKNFGLAFARNYGIKISNGDLITYCDDDDFLPSDLLNNYYFFLITHKIDLVIGLKNFNKKSYNSIKDLMLDGVTPPVGSHLFKSKYKQYFYFNENISTGVDHSLWINLLNKKNLKIGVYYGSVILEQSSNRSYKNTNDTQKRLLGIKKSLKIWKRDLIEEFGYNFFIFFCKQYELYINSHFLKLSIKNLEFSKFYQFLNFKSIIFIIKSIIRNKFFNSNSTFEKYYE